MAPTVAPPNGSTSHTAPQKRSAKVLFLADDGGRQRASSIFFFGYRGEEEQAMDRSVEQPAADVGYT